MATNGEKVNGSGGTDLEATQTRATYMNKAAEELSQEHYDYLMKTHGHVDLDPMPSMDDADPYNWPLWKKTTNLVLVAFHAMMSTFTAASIIPAFGDIAMDLGVTLQRTSYLTSLQIAILGGAPIFWKPLSHRFGRRPIFILSLVVSLVANCGCAKAQSYATMATARAFVAFFISPAMAIGSGVVTEVFFKRERARYIGVWTLMVTLGVPVGPFIFGFVAYHVNYRWIYWILAIINGVQLLLYLFLGPETRYLRSGVTHSKSTFKEEYFKFKRIDPKPLTITEFLQPLLMARHLCVVIPAISYSMIFLTQVLITVELPQLFIPKFEFNPQQLGLQFLSIIIGTVIGEQMGGITSDIWMSRRAKKIGHRPEPEYRLWLSYHGFLLTIIGTVVFLVQTDHAKEGHWNVTPLVGAAIGAAGNQLVTTVLVTYAVDCYVEESASVGVIITFVRQIWGFIGPFWFPPMFSDVGVAASAGVMTALIMGLSVFPTLALQFYGRHWRPASTDTGLPAATNGHNTGVVTNGNTTEGTVQNKETVPAPTVETEAKGEKKAVETHEKV